MSGRGVAPTLTGGHIGVQHSSALAADAVAQPVAATRASALEVGFHDDTLGWLSVRASSDLAGDLHATVSARSQVSTPAVENMLPALERFLQDHSVAVHSVSGATAVGTVPVPAVGNTSSASTLHANTTGGGAGNQAGGTGGNSPRNSGGSNSPQQRQSAWQQQSGVASTLWTADLATAPSFAQVERTSVVSVRI